MLHVLKKQILDDFGKVQEEIPLNASTNLRNMRVDADFEGRTDEGDVAHIDYDVESI